MYVRTPAIEAHRNSMSGGVPIADFTALNLPSKYSISPPHLKKASRRLCNMIANTKILEDARAKAKSNNAHDGLALLRQEYNLVSTYMDDKALAAIDFAIDGFLSMGLPEMRQSCFSDLSRDVEGWNKVHRRPMDAPMLAGKYSYEVMMQKHLSEAELLRFDTLVDKNTAHRDLEKNA